MNLPEIRGKSRNSIYRAKYLLAVLFGMAWPPVAVVPEDLTWFSKETYAEENKCFILNSATLQKMCRFLFDFAKQKDWRPTRLSFAWRTNRLVPMFAGCSIFGAPLTTGCCWLLVGCLVAVRMIPWTPRRRMTSLRSPLPPWVASPTMARSMRIGSCSKARDLGRS